MARFSRRLHSGGGKGGKEGWGEGESGGGLTIEKVVQRIAFEGVVRTVPVERLSVLSVSDGERWNVLCEGL